MSMADSMSPLSNLPGPWRWEKRGDNWWRVHDDLRIEDGPHRFSEEEEDAAARSR